MNDLSQVIEHLRAARPHMRAMGDALDRYAAPSMTLAQCLNAAHVLEGCIRHHAELCSTDVNLDEAARMMTDVCLDLAGAIRDEKNEAETC